MFCCTEQEKRELIALWHQAFGDREREIETFFSRFSKTGEVLFDRDEGHVVSALYLLPQQLWLRGEKYPVAYLYAAATDERHRGGGRMGGLIARAFSRCEEQGMAACVTLPASDSLYGYYERFGFEPCYGQRLARPRVGGELPKGIRPGLDYRHYCAVLERTECALVKSRETFETALSYPGVWTLSFEGGYAVFDRKQMVDAVGNGLDALAINEKQNTFTTNSDYMGEPVRYGSIKCFRALPAGLPERLYLTMMME